MAFTGGDAEGSLDLEHTGRRIRGTVPLQGIAVLSSAAIDRFMRPILLPGGKEARLVSAVMVEGASNAGASADMTFVLKKMIAVGNGRVAAVEGVDIPINSTALAITQPIAGGAAGRRTVIPLAPDERRGNARNASTSGAGTTTTLVDTNALEGVDTYLNSIIKRLATGEVRPVSDYSGGTGTFTVSPAFATATVLGEPYEVIHDQMIFRNGDLFIVDVTAAGGATAFVDTSVGFEMVVLSQTMSNAL